jgi:hypothetical protein
MARIFTTRFNFNERSYDAIVTISSLNDTLTFSIRLMDQELFELIPEGYIRYSGKDGFKQLAGLNDNKLAQALMRSIVKAIEQYTEELV